MHLSDFDFTLSPELIASYPLATRSASRLLCVDGDVLQHRYFTDVLDLISAGDLLVFNDTKVIPARLIGKRITGGHVEVLVERVVDTQHVLVQLRASKKPYIGERLIFSSYTLTVVKRDGLFYLLRYDCSSQSVLDLIEEIGHVPLPPYLQRCAEDSDRVRYQTVYAKHKGSIAAPTAGFHFDEVLLRRLQEKGVNIGYLTLHIGAGTFLPVRVENLSEHVMHAEYCEVSTDLCEQILQTRRQGRRVIAVGTTSLRALESASQHGIIQPYRGDTHIFIYPGYQFHCVDALMTNLHLPCSSLLMLVCAFGGYQQVMRAYREAVAQSYRFYSYGDAMWLNLRYHDATFRSVL